MDIAAEQPIIAQRQGRQILVEVKRFLGRSFISDFEDAVGQYIVYRDILLETDSSFDLYLAVAEGTYNSNFQRKLTQMIVRRNRVKLIVFDSQNQVIKQWID